MQKKRDLRKQITDESTKIKKIYDMMKTLGNEFSKQLVEQFNLSYKQMKFFYTTKEEKMAEEHLICCVKKRKNST